ncbi:MAG: TonB-dependent receptor plug domain-containing protein, partial [Desulfomonilia bacterium]
MRRFCIIVATAAVLCSLPAHASEQQLEEVVVTATKTQQAASEAPASVEVVKGEEMREKNIHFPDQALRYLPGVFSERRGGTAGIADSFAPLHLRGMPSSSQSLVLLDGQPMNNYEGNVHWWAIPVENIERIEVVKGPFSSLYGGGAMGGVVNVITDPVYSPLEVTYGYGSYKTRLISAGHGLSVGDFTYSIVFRSFEMDDPEQTST